jgi:hypothetical protein
VAEGGRIEPGTHARDPLQHTEYNAITDQAAQLLYEADHQPPANADAAELVQYASDWIKRACAVLREVAGG